MEVSFGVMAVTLPAEREVTMASPPTRLQKRVKRKPMSEAATAVPVGMPVSFPMRNSKARSRTPRPEIDIGRAVATSTMGITDMTVTAPTG